ncbi:hypothetical protein CBS9595_000549 [Malassezia furfur]|nr:hypothetical protein CBS9595_000549 [Malassezia furfur]
MAALAAREAPSTDQAQAGWEAVLGASDAIDAVRDALFVVEEMRQEHAVMWECAPSAEHRAKTSTSSLLLSLDEASGRLIAAQGLTSGRISQAHAHTEPGVDKACALVQSEWDVLHARVSSTLAELQTDRVLIVLHDVCSQAHRLMDSLDSALQQYTSATTDRDNARHVFETRRAHYVPACLRVLAVLRTNAATYLSLRPNVAQHIDAVHARWHALQPRLEPAADEVSAAMQTLSLHTPRYPREKRRARDSGGSRRSSYNTPSKLPRTPQQRPPVPPTPLGVQTEPRFFGRLADVAGARPTRLGLPDALSSPQPTSSPNSPVSPGMYYKPPPTSLPTPLSAGKVRPGESMLPRLSHPRPHDDASPSVRRASHQVLRSPASMQTLRPRFSSSELPRPVRAGAKTYVPDARDALDVGVARICNARSIPVERLDTGSALDEYHRYTLLSKTVACRLLRTQRPEQAHSVDPRHIHVRVGGGWRELAQWIDAHTLV